MTSNNSLRPLTQLWALVLRTPMIYSIQYMSETFILIGTHFVTTYSVDTAKKMLCLCL